MPLRVGEIEWDTPLHDIPLGGICHGVMGISAPVVKLVVAPGRRR